LERMWKEGFISVFKVLPRNLPGGTDGNLSPDYLPQGRDLNLELFEYQGMLTTMSRRWFVTPPTFLHSCVHGTVPEKVTTGISTAVRTATLTDVE
jgi:hypothetical protein